MKHTPAEVQRLADLMQRQIDQFRREAARFDRAARDAQPGYPTSTMGGGGGSGGDVSDPTSRFALEHRDLDPTRDLDAWYKAWETAGNAVEELGHIRSRYLAAMSVVKLCNNPQGCPGPYEAHPYRKGRCERCYRASLRSDSDAAA